MSSRERRLEIIASTAALYKPEQIHSKLVLLLNALLFQHECVLTDLLDHKDRDEIMGSFHAFSQDTCALELMIKILHTIEPDFERASAGSVREVLKLSKEKLVDDYIADQKEQLENLLNDN